MRCLDLVVLKSLTLKSAKLLMQSKHGIETNEVDKSTSRYQQISLTPGNFPSCVNYHSLRTKSVLKNVDFIHLGSSAWLISYLPIQLFKG